MGAPEAHSIAYFEVETGLDRVKIGKVLAGVEPDLVKGARKLYLMRTLMERLLHADGKQAKTAKENSAQILTQAKADLLLIQLKEKQGEVVSIAEAKKVVRDVLSACRARLLSIPTRLAGRLAGVKEPAKVKALLDKAVHSALEEVSGFDPSKLKRKGGKK